MSDAKIALLPDRGVVSVSGPDAAKLLQGLLTSDIDTLGDGVTQLAALLSPQGKILFEMLVTRGNGAAMLLETGRTQAPGLAQRLQLYKLRANVEIRDASPDFTVAAGWGNPIIEGDAVVRRDTRHPDLGVRIIASMATDGTFAKHDAAAAPAPDYHAHRIGLGIPEAGRDYDCGDTFPHEANFDLNGGIAFDKGCFVGQEVVSRMEHKSVVRKRIVRVTANADLPDDRPIVTVGTATIGRLGSVAGPRGLALVRLDRAAEAIDKGESLAAAGLSLTVDPVAIEMYRASAAQRNAP